MPLAAKFVGRNSRQVIQMHRKTFRDAAKATLSLAIRILTLLALGTGASAATEKVLHAFDLTDGGQPSGGLVFDAQGNLYGTTLEGGTSGQKAGTVFELSPASDGSWTETVLYSFTGGQDGAGPNGRVIFDAQGNLYGTTAYGGASNFGTVFKLTRGSDGTWTEAVLHSFTDGTDGESPFAGLVFDPAGNLYGTTVDGGTTNGFGTVFSLKPVSEGRWKEEVIHRFQGGRDGIYPFGGVIVDAAGNLYGATSYGGGLGCVGLLGCGTVFKLRPNANGTFTEQVLYRFTGSEGVGPNAGVILDTAGNLYGTTSSGAGSGCGGIGCGTVFELSPLSGGGWKTHFIYRFNVYWHGWQPDAGLVLDAAGNLYGTAAYGGGRGCGGIGCGVVFELKPPGSSGGKWRETVLHRFSPKQGDGSKPIAEPTLDAVGNVYGTTVSGGTSNVGLVFEITP
jgi:uncharacterized repeat protein (TIGR03803 family)